MAMIPHACPQPHFGTVVLRAADDACGESRGTHRLKPGDLQVTVAARPGAAAVCRICEPPVGGVIDPVRVRRIGKDQRVVVRMHRTRPNVTEGIAAVGRFVEINTAQENGRGVGRADGECMSVAAVHGERDASRTRGSCGLTP